MNLDTDDPTKTLVLAVVLAVLPVFVLDSSYYIRLLDHFLLFALFAVALNLVFGHTDQLFLFVGGLAGVGAYTTAILSDMFGITAWVTLLVGVALAGTIGGVVSWISARLRFTVVLISILTLNLQLALVQFFVGARNITGGTTGFQFSGLKLEAVGELVGVSRNVVLYYLLVVLLVLGLLLYSRLVNSKYGLAFSALREDEVAAESIGVNVVRYKTIAGVISAMMIGITGVMAAQFQQYILPAQFTFTQVDVIVLIMLIVGGLRTTFGPVYGAAIIILIEEALQGIGGWRTAIFGALLIVLFLYFRRGIVPAAYDVFNDIRAKYFDVGPDDMRSESN
jgi:branched-chain amino acid transport system permease protein